MYSVVLATLIGVICCKRKRVEGGQQSSSRKPLPTWSTESEFRGVENIGSPVILPDRTPAEEKRTPTSNRGIKKNDNCEGKTLSEANKADLALLHEVENMKQGQSAYENFGPSGGDAEGADNAKKAAKQKSQRIPKTARIVQNLGSDFDVEGTQVEKSASRKLLPEPTPPLRERRSASNSKRCDR